MSFFWQISSAVVLWKGMENAGVLDVFPFIILKSESKRSPRLPQTNCSDFASAYSPHIALGRAFPAA